jgi:hypothetical protein
VAACAVLDLAADAMIVDTQEDTGLAGAIQRALDAYAGQPVSILDARTPGERPEMWRDILRRARAPRWEHRHRSHVTTLEL